MRGAENAWQPGEVHAQQPGLTRDNAEDDDRVEDERHCGDAKHAHNTIRLH